MGDATGRLHFPPGPFQRTEVISWPGSYELCTHQNDSLSSEGLLSLNVAKRTMRSRMPTESCGAQSRYRSLMSR